ncbi:cytochrome P450 1A1-like [Haliotis rubra]|uniref:cytochrome P450 1A1-like n=1 Tax=Haliotis rubra TaxID=36100 RepID=UPI001EE51FD7|nr:cytochrome P450 1A1-like [Haliotis rubra]
MSEEVHKLENCLATVFNFPTLFFTCLFIYIYRKFCMGSGINVLPGPWCLPLVGYYPFLGEKAHLTLTRLGNKYGPVFRLSLGMSEVIVINSRQLAKEALVGKGDDFADKPRLKLLSILPKNATYSFHPFDEFWKLQHKTLLPVWNRYIQSSRSTIEQIISSEVEHFESMVSPATSFHLFKDLRRSVFSIIYQVCYGRSTNIHTNRDFLYSIELYENSPIFPTGKNLFHFINFLPWISYFLPTYERNLRACFKRISEYHVRKMNQLINTSGHCECFAYQLGKTCEDISENVPETVSKGVFLSINAIFGGATFAPLNVLVEALCLMAVYPDIQQRVRKEIHSVVSSDQRPGWQDRPRLPFSDAVLLETLRFRPSDGVILPHSTLCNTSLHGFDITKGTVVLFNIHAMHFDQTDWHRPEEFLPERFLDSNGKVDQVSRSKLMSFSAGKRKCIGEAFVKMELLLLFTGLLQKCEFTQGYSETDSTTKSENMLVRLVKNAD